MNLTWTFTHSLEHSTFIILFSGAKNQHIAKEAESLLLNVAGKLLMFPRDNTGPQSKDQNSPKNKSVSFKLDGFSMNA